MDTIKFKTNIKCGGCIATVTPHLNNLPEVTAWNVDTNTADKILTVEGSSAVTAQQIVDTLEKAGFKAEVV